MVEYNNNENSNHDFWIKGTVLKKYLGNDTKVVVPYGITEIGEFAFFGKHVEEVVLPQTMKVIGSKSFWNCDLKVIEFPDGIETIESKAFEGCEKLEEVVLPRSIIALGTGILYGCSCLKKLSIHDTTINTIPSWDHSFYLGIPNGLELVLYGEISLEMIVKLQELIKTLRSLVFDQEKSECMIIDGCVVSKDKKVLYTTFSGDIIIPAGVQIINNLCFFGNRDLISVQMPEGIKKLDSHLFAGCINLESVYLPSTISNIEFGAFFGCPKLNNIEISTNNKNYCVNNGAIFTIDKKLLVSCPHGNNKEFVVPEETRIINQDAFAFNNHIKTIDFSNVEVISPRAAACAHFQKIIIGNTTQYIGDEAFGWNDYVSELHIHGQASINYDFEYNLHQDEHTTGTILLPLEKIKIISSAFIHSSRISFDINDSKYAISVVNISFSSILGSHLQIDASYEEIENCTWG